MTNPRPIKGKKRIYRTYYQGAIITIYEKILKPAAARLAALEEERALDEGIRRFFHTDTRSVYFAKAKEEFSIPGKEWISQIATFLKYGTGSPRKVMPGMKLIVRIDEHDQKVDIEFGEAIFTMNMRAWNRIKDRVNLIG